MTVPIQNYEFLQYKARKNIVNMDSDKIQPCFFNYYREINDLKD